MAEGLTKRRIDALPEHIRWEDTGHPRCLECPLAVCIFEKDVRGDHRRDMERTAREMALLFNQGEPTQSLAKRFKVSHRTVFRYLVLAERLGLLVRCRRTVLAPA